MPRARVLRRAASQRSVFGRGLRPRGGADDDLGSGVWEAARSRAMDWCVTRWMSEGDRLHGERSAMRYAMEMLEVAMDERVVERAQSALV